MEALPTKVFRRAFQTQLLNHLRPPSRADLGTHARKLKPIQSMRKIVDELLSLAHFVPQEDESSGILHLSPGGVVKPTKSTSPPNGELLPPPLGPPCRGGPRGGFLRAPTSSSKGFLFLFLQLQRCAREARTGTARSACTRL